MTTKQLDLLLWRSRSVGRKPNERAWRFLNQSAHPPPRLSSFSTASLISERRLIQRLSRKAMVQIFIGSEAFHTNSRGIFEAYSNWRHGLGSMGFGQSLSLTCLIVSISISINYTPYKIVISRVAQERAIDHPFIFFSPHHFYFSATMLKPIIH